LALHRQPSFGRGCGNQLEDNGVADKRLAAPVLTDPGEETMLDLVPLPALLGKHFVSTANETSISYCWF
jgi:hypothetical protein